MKETWVIKNRKGDVQAVAKEQGISPITARVLINRGLDTKEERDVFLHPSVSGLRGGKSLLNAEKAGNMLKKAVSEGKSIRIIGDYDVDGITSTYILYRSLLQIGAKVSFQIPNRISDGYGINRSMVGKAINDGIQVILTCDNGISEFETIKYAKENGLQVIVTDHHEVPVNELGEQVLPPADVVVNPHQTGETTLFTGVCGCVVAMKVLETMGIDIMPLLPYAATATLCDVMELRDENRVIVVLGLSELRRTKDVGLQALIAENQLEKARVSAYHIGFVIGPCLNASGRLDTAEKALRLLLEREPEDAKKTAAELVSLNSERKAMTEEGVRRAEEIIETVAKSRAAEAGDSDWEKYIDKVLVVYLKDCHESIAGIIAGRVRERFYRPTFILTNSENGVKGSGRSIESWSMYEEMSRISDAFTRFGGHPMAAGLSLEMDRIGEMQSRLNENCTLSEEELTKKIRIDARLPFEQMSVRLVDELAMLEPFGKGCEKALFAEKDIKVTRAYILGKNRNVLKLNMTNGAGVRCDGVYFGDAAEFMDRVSESFGEEECNKMFRGVPNNVRLVVTYVPDINEFNGVVSLQARLQDFKMQTD